MSSHNGDTGPSSMPKQEAEDLFEELSSHERP